jgi:hypothetical protein
MNVKVFAFVAVVMSLMSGAVEAQNVVSTQNVPSDQARLLISVASSDKPGSPVSEACQKEVNIFTSTAAHYPQPKQWHVVIICDDASWNALMAKVQKNGGFLLANSGSPRETDIDNQYGLTDIDHNYTLLRGNTLLYPPFWGSPDRVISHELAHVLLHSRNEDQVDEQAQKWTKQNKKNPGSLVAGVQLASWVPASPAVDAK